MDVLNYANPSETGHVIGEADHVTDRDAPGAPDPVIGEAEHVTDHGADPGTDGPPRRTSPISSNS